MDDVVVEDVEMFRAEQMDDGHLWLCCYFRNGERVTFGAHAEKKGLLHFDVVETPPEWIDWDERRRNA